jgi:6-phosphogluconate dehydrogenase
MGRNLLYNIADNGFSVAGFDLDAEKARELNRVLHRIRLSKEQLWRILYLHWKHQEKLF